MPDRTYCTIAEVIAELETGGAQPDESVLMRAVRHASDFIDRRIGAFIPFTETRWFDGNGERDLFIDPCLAVTAITDDGDAVTNTQYRLYPLNRHWPGGPYTRLGIDEDATELGYWTFQRRAVSVAGRWGKYEESIATGATTTQADGTTTSLLASSGANISPGAVLLVESEQELVEATGAATDSTANCEAITAAGEDFICSDGSLLNTGEILKVEFEQMKLLDKAANRLYVARGWNGTKRVAHSTGLDIYVYRAFTVKRGVNGTSGASHSAKAISRYIPPYDVASLAVMLAALYRKMAQTGFSGRAGNAELGESFYYKAFPSEIKEIQRNYRITSL
jgi:hypothetical protein